MSFYSDGSIEAGVAGFLNFTHSARADSGKDFVWPLASAGRDWQHSR
jgi:hypothetical protein